MKKPVVLLILDGFGLSDNKEGNAAFAANTPCIDRLKEEYPFVKGEASGLAVGLPEGQMGNSEVGHLNMGAGRIVYQDLTKITKSIEDGSFFKKQELLDAIENCRNNNSNLHIYGLVSDGGVHSDIKHLYALIDLCKKEDFNRVFIHCFMDGRDTSPTSGVEYIKELSSYLKDTGIGTIATISGRYYSMDRDNRWERIEKAYNALVFGQGIIETDAVSAMENSYAKGVTDEFIEPTVIVKNGKPVANIKDGDSIIFFNFRPDRAREITKTFCLENFDGFKRENRVNTFYVCFTDYDSTIPNKYVVFKDEEIVNTFGEYISKCNLRQARIAETEKYAHVTFFFNGGVETPNDAEDRFLVDSPKVATYDLKPEMSAVEVCDLAVDKIKSGDYDCIIINFANPDMVGHTGIMPAVIQAVETVDKCVDRIVKAIKEVDGVIFFCADHGNCEELINLETNEPWTAHTTNPVPFILINAEKGVRLRENGKLCDIAPTLLELLGLPKPEEMTGESLLIK